MRVVLPIAFALLAACQPVPPDLDRGQDTCGTGPWQVLAGQAIAAVAALPAGARVIGPGDAVTKDFRPSRLNIDLDATGLIVRAWCG